MAQCGPRGLREGPRERTRGPQCGPIGPQGGPRGPETSRLWPKTARDGPRGPKDDTEGFQKDPEAPAVGAQEGTRAHPEEREGMGRQKPRKLCAAVRWAPERSRHIWGDPISRWASGPPRFWRWALSPSSP
eukprot:8850582-Pyramimonas_sp.AAC.1